MPIAFWDTSALVKRYRTAELGSEYVLSIFDDNIYTKFIISLTIVEFLNVFYRLKREQYINNQTLTEIIDAFYSDIFNEKISVYSINDTHIYCSERIIEKIHLLKSVKKRPSPFDAILISCCNDFDKEDLVLISSDLDLNNLAKLEGIRVINPELIM